MELENILVKFVCWNKYILVKFIGFINNFIVFEKDKICFIIEFYFLMKEEII